METHEMTSEVFRNKFMAHVGKEKYLKFVLTLYEAFPLRNKLLSWQEKLLANFSIEFGQKLTEIEDVYSVFNSCPIHHVELEKDTVQIVDGNTYQAILPYNEAIELFPMAHVDAPRNVEMFDYPETVEVLYCLKCREKRKNVAQRQP